MNKEFYKMKEKIILSSITISNQVTLMETFTIIIFRSEIYFLV